MYNRYPRVSLLAFHLSVTEESLLSSLSMRGPTRTRMVLEGSTMGAVQGAAGVTVELPCEEHDNVANRVMTLVRV